MVARAEWREQAVPVVTRGWWSVAVVTGGTAARALVGVLMAVTVAPGDPRACCPCGARGEREGKAVPERRAKPVIKLPNQGSRVAMVSSAAGEATAVLVVTAVG